MREKAKKQNRKELKKEKQENNDAKEQKEEEIPLFCISKKPERSDKTNKREREEKGKSTTKQKQEQKKKRLETLCVLRDLAIVFKRR
jgi:hypothetical protein